MTAIFGICNLDGRPADVSHLEEMKKAIVTWGPDRSKLWAEGPIGLGCLPMSDNTESLLEAQPLHSRSGHLVLVAAVRLDNREDLFRIFGTSTGDRANTPDSALILSAYERWGTACPEHLLGDWAFAVWDSFRNQLFIARDHYGVCGLYYYRDNRRIVFASSLKAILAVPDIPRHLNPLAIGGFGTSGLRGGAVTPYLGILRLTPAQALTISASKTELRHYWHPRDAPDVRYPSDQGYVEAFLDIFSEAVRCRLRGDRPVGIMLSGGLDSGSIATLAARELAKTGRTLQAFCAIPMFDVTETAPRNRHGDESRQAEETCLSAKNIELTISRSENITPLRATERMIEILELPHPTPNAGWVLTLLDIARQRQIGTMLDGWGGNFTISWTGNRDKYLSLLMKRGKWMTFAGEVNAWRKENASSLWLTIKSQMLKPLIPPCWQEKRLRLHARRTWIVNQSRVIRASAQDQPIIRMDREATEAVNPGLHHYYRSGKGAISSELAAAYGMEASQPALDKRVIEFCMGLPPEQFIRNGHDRMLIRRAMTGLMPENVLQAKSRGIQYADIGHRIRANRDEIGIVLRSFAGSPLVRHYLNLRRLDRSFQEILRRLDPGSLLAGSILTAGLSIGLFLQRFENGH